jgi:translin
MTTLSQIISAVNDDFSAKSIARDETLRLSRTLISHCARAIQATHRTDRAEAQALLDQAQAIAQEMLTIARAFADVYHAGYTQDALKELAEAYLIRAFILDEPMPTPQDLDVENAAYLNGLAEAGTELRRHALNALRRNDMATAEQALNLMEDIYSELMTVDFPSAITGGLRRQNDILRSVLERTRGDVTTAVRQEAMREALAAFEARMGG